MNFVVRPSNWETIGNRQARAERLRQTPNAGVRRVGRQTPTRSPLTHRFAVEPSTLYCAKTCSRYSEPLLDHPHYGHLSCRVPRSPRSSHARRHRQHSQPTTPSTPPRQRSERSTRRCVVNVRQKRLYQRHPSWTTIPSGKASSCRCSPPSPKSPTRRNAKSPA